MHTRQWIGTYGGRGNGDYQSELALALQAIKTYLAHFALTTEAALVRLDGQYGDAVVITQLIQAGVSLVTRGRTYRMLELKPSPVRPGQSVRVIAGVGKIDLPPMPDWDHRKCVSIWQVFLLFSLATNKGGMTDGRCFSKKDHIPLSESRGQGRFVQKAN